MNNNKNEFDIIEFFICFMVTIGILCCIILGLAIKFLPEQDSQSNTQSYNNIETFYKTIDVKVTNIKQTWGAVNLKKWQVDVKSDEYNLTGSFEVYVSNMNGDRVGYDIFKGHIKTGSIVKAELWSETVNGNVSKRRIDKLK